MGPILLAIEAVGTWVADNAAIIEGVALAASAVTAGVEMRVSGIAADKAARQRARAEQDKANAQQIQMRQNALRAIATQNAATQGHFGTGGPTSFAAGVRRQSSEEGLDLLTSRAGASVTTSMLRQQGQNESDAGTIGALSKSLSGLTNKDLLSSLGTTDTSPLTPTPFTQQTQLTVPQ